MADSAAQATPSLPAFAPPDARYTILHTIQLIGSTQASEEITTSRFTVFKDPASNGMDLNYLRVVLGRELPKSAKDALEKYTAEESARCGRMLAVSFFAHDGCPERSVNFRDQWESGKLMQRMSVEFVDVGPLP